ncbi:MAG: winged helix-turn-helix transcriptional regulator [Myxococcota bacterium]
MRWKDIGEVHCSVARSLSVVGDRWTLLILRDCFLGRRRFDHLLASLEVSPHLLSTRLSKLVEHGILERRPYRERPVRCEYRLTDKGIDLYPVIVGLLRWGDRWMLEDAAPPLTLVHEDCGHTVTPTLACSACGEDLDPRRVRPVLNPQPDSPSTRAPSRSTP